MLRFQARVHEAFCARMKNFDLIADVHGRDDKLVALLKEMGYHHDGIGYIPPAGHQAVFLGDLIDTKPGHERLGGVRATLEMVRTMVDRGHALVVMGNHEFNAICYHSRGPDGEWLRIRGSGNRKQHAGTLADFPDWEDPASEWQTVWLPWMKRMPFWLDLGGLRVIHACWHEDHQAVVAGRSLEDDSFLIACASKATPEGRAIETLLKGVEVPLPDPHTFKDHTGAVRKDFRARWWERPDDGVACRNLVFPENTQIVCEPVDPAHHDLFRPYPEEDVPIFFGHYFKPADHALGPERHNVACLDHSAATGGPLVAYRWKGERSLQPNHYVAAP